MHHENKHSINYPELLFVYGFSIFNNKPLQHTEDDLQIFNLIRDVINENKIIDGGRLRISGSRFC